MINLIVKSKLISYAAGVLLLSGVGYTAIPEINEYTNVPLNEQTARELTIRHWNSFSIPIKANIVRRESWLLPDQELEIKPTTYKTEFHGKWINWLDSNDNFIPINTDFTASADGFVMDNAPFKAKAPLGSGGVAQMINDNRFDLAKREKILDDPLTLSIQALGTTNVLGRIERGDLFSPNGIQKNVSYVIYDNAYPQGDLIYYVDFGIVPKLEKLIRFRSPPARLDYEFVLSYSKNVEVAKLGQSGKKVWDKLSKLNVLSGETLSTHVGTSSRKIGIDRLWIWDSDSSYTLASSSAKRNIAPITGTLEPIGINQYLFTKYLPIAFFVNPIYPVFTDVVTTVFPDPDPETTSGDGGTAVEAVDETWGTIRTTLGTNAYPTDATTGATGYGCTTTTNKFRVLHRATFIFDTSSIPDADTIDSAILSIGFGSSSDAAGGAPDTNIYIQNKTDSDTNIVITHHDNTGTTAFSTAITFANWSTVDYNDFTLNTDGLNNISKTGNSRFATRNANYDVANVLPAWSSNAFSRTIPATADSTGTGNDPKLAVTHTGIVEAGAPKIIIISRVKFLKNLFVNPVLAYMPDNL